MLKKSLSIFLAVLMMISALTISSSAMKICYYVAGDTALCGSDWVPDDENNQMTEDTESDSQYTKLFKDVAPGVYCFKVTDGSWLNCWGFADGRNYTFRVYETCDVTILFDDCEYFVDVIGTDLEVLDTIAVNTVTVVGDEGLTGEDWQVESENNMMDSEDGETFTKTFKCVAPGQYAFKFAAESAWYFNWGCDSEFAIGDMTEASFDGSNIPIEVEKYSDVTISFYIDDLNGETGEGAYFKVEYSEPQGEIPTGGEIEQPETEVTKPDTVPVEPGTEETEPGTGAGTVPATTEAPVVTNPPETDPEPTTEPVPTTPQIWVGGVEVTSENAANITGEGISGSVTYDEETRCLTLKNATISLGKKIVIDEEDNEYYAGIYSTLPMNIHLIGANVIDFDDSIPEDKAYNLYGVVGYVFDIDGNGSLSTRGINAYTVQIHPYATVETHNYASLKYFGNAVRAENLFVCGELDVKGQTLYHDFPAIYTKNMEIEQGARCTVYTSNYIPSSPSPYAAKGICIAEGGYLSVYGSLSIEAEGTIAGDSTSSQVNNAYGIYGKSGAELNVYETPSIEISAKRQAIAYITINLKKDNISVKAGSSAEEAEEIALSGIEGQKYVSFKYNAPAQPTSPTELTNPTYPVTPTDPATDPTEPANPTSPAQPNEPTQPAEPAGPAEPTEGNPQQPEATTAPVENDQPTTAPNENDQPTTAPNENDQPTTAPGATQPVTREDASSTQPGYQQFTWPADAGQPATVAPVKVNDDKSKSGNITTKKKTNPIKVTIKKRYLTAKNIANNDKKYKLITISKAKGSVKVKMKSGYTFKKYFAVKSKKYIVVKKRTPAGKYKIPIVITAKGNSEYKGKTLNKIVRITIIKK